jgi:hypothetical protein
MPEIQGCILGLRQGELGVKGSFFVISLGFGTCEAILSTEAGPVQRTAVSVNGLRYAVNLLMQDIGRQYYLELKNEHQIDIAFQKGFLFANRKRVDLKEARSRALQQYYTDVISPALRKAFLDTDFQRADTLYVVGGGAYYEDLLEQFRQEFKDILQITVPENPAAMASKGYCLQALAASGDKSTAVGIDIGNATTIVTMFDENARDNNRVQSQAKQSEDAEITSASQPKINTAAVKAASPAKAMVLNDLADTEAPVAETKQQQSPKVEKPATKRIQKFLISGTW